MKKKEEKEHKTGKTKETKEKSKMIKVKESDYHSLVQDAADYKEKCVRLYADFENTRKRFDREKTEFVKYANEDLISEFLEIMDDLERSIAAVHSHSEDTDSFRKGIELVASRIQTMLEKYNVKQIESVGKPFDPHCQEVLMQEDSPDHEDGYVIEEFQKGYYLGEKVVRTAKVKVAANKSSATQIKENGSS